MLGRPPCYGALAHNGWHQWAAAHQQLINHEGQKVHSRVRSSSRIGHGCCDITRLTPPGAGVFNHTSSLYWGYSWYHRDEHKRKLYINESIDMEAAPQYRYVSFNEHIPGLIKQCAKHRRANMIKKVCLVIYKELG